MSTFGVVLDANVLVPMALCDTLMRSAAERLFRPLWTDQIFAEVERTLVNNNMATPEAAMRRIIAMKDAQPYSMVRGYKQLIKAMTNDPKDRHVLAAAVRSEAQIIVTENVSDFPLPSLEPYDIEVQRPDEFRVNQYELNPLSMERIIRGQAGALTRLPPFIIGAGLSPIEYVLASLYKITPNFASLMKAQLLSAPVPVPAKRLKNHEL